MVQIEKPGIIKRARNGSALSRVGARKEIQPIEINKTQIIRCRFDNWEPSNSAVYGCGPFRIAFS